MFSISNLTVNHSGEFFSISGDASFQSSVSLHHIPRAQTRPDAPFSGRLTNLGSSSRSGRGNRANEPVKYLPDSGQIVRVVPDWLAPKEVLPDGVRPKNVSGYLEVTDAVNKTLRYIPIPGWVLLEEICRALKLCIATCTVIRVLHGRDWWNYRSSIEQ